ncbi:MAG: hypothetical protein ACLU8B_10735 [Lachnospiraceae bacterium]
MLRSSHSYKNGIAAPSHCRSGECGWCHSRCLI